jgi:hypothetical protein
MSWVWRCSHGNAEADPLIAANYVVYSRERIVPREYSRGTVKFRVQVLTRAGAKNPCATSSSYQDIGAYATRIPLAMMVVAAAVFLLL